MYKRSFLISMLASLGCTPPGFAESADFYSNPFVSEALVLSSYKSQLRSSIAERFVDLLGKTSLTMTFAPGDFSAEVLKQTVSDFDVIATALASRVDDVYSNKRLHMRGTLEKENWKLAKALNSREQAWVERYMKCFIANQDLHSLLQVIWVLAPDKAVIPSATWPEYESVFGLYSGSWFLARAVLTLESRVYLPKRFNVPERLNETERVLHEAKSLQSDIFTAITNNPIAQVVRTVIAMQDWMTPSLRPYFEDETDKRLKLLAQKTRCAARSKTLCY